MNLESIKNKLTEKGYYVDIREYSNQKYVTGGIEKDGSLILGVEIKISFDDEGLFILDFDKQIGEKRRFDNEESLLVFIYEKYPIEEN